MKEQSGRMSDDHSDRGIAGEHLDTPVPPARVRDRVRAHGPATAAGEPEDVHRAGEARRVEDVRLTREEHALLAVGLLLHQPEDLAEEDGEVLVVPECYENRAVQLRAREPVTGESGYGGWLFDGLAEPCLEVVAEVGNPDPRLHLSAIVEDELFPGAEAPGEGRDGDGADRLEKWQYRRVERLQAAHAPELIPVHLLNVGGIAEIGEEPLLEDRLNLFTRRDLKH